jgi:hypothetical protein
MDTYVRWYEANEKTIGDNPTIGLILEFDTILI